MGPRTREMLALTITAASCAWTVASACLALPGLMLCLDRSKCMPSSTWIDHGGGTVPADHLGRQHLRTAFGRDYHGSVPK